MTTLQRLTGRAPYPDNFTTDQKNAASAILDWVKAQNGPGVLRVNGRAGTGKTGLAAHIAGRMYASVLAPTGKASQVLVGRGIRHATTIHRGLYWYDPDKLDQLDAKDETGDDTGAGGDAWRNDEWAEDEDQPADDGQLFAPTMRLRRADAIIVDECSMVGTGLANDLRRVGKPIIAFGDDFQLPPVNDWPGFAEADETIELNEITRQARDSPIIALAERIRNNDALRITPGDSDGLCVTPKPKQAARRSELLRDCQQVIAGSRKAVAAYNARVRLERGYETVYPVAGDRLVCERNNRIHRISNGTVCMAHSDTRPFADGIGVLDMQRARNRDPQSYPIWMQNFNPDDDRPGNYRRIREVLEMAFAYALTCHRSQGSQWATVGVIDDSFLWDGLERNQWLYTAVTRAARRLVLLTDRAY